MTQVTKPRETQPKVQVVAKPKRRRFTAQYKRQILEQADACTKTGELSALLRREGLFKTLKYRPEYPGRFDELSQGESHCRGRCQQK